MEENLNNINNTEESQDGIDFMELLTICLSKWKWFLISVVICVFLGGIHILRSVPTYTRSASLLVKDDNKGVSISNDVSNAFANMGLGTSKSNVNNELYTIESPATVLGVIKKLHLDISYSTDGFFHDTLHYGSNLPLKVYLPDIADNEGASFTLKYDNDGNYSISRLISRTYKKSHIKEVYEGTIGDTLSTPIGRLIVYRTEYFNPDKEPLELHVSRTPINAATTSFSERLTVELADKQATVLNLSFTDASTQRAEDFLNTLIEVYGDNWIKDQNEITVATSRFIDNRLVSIEKELGSVDQDISSYKSENLLPNVDEASKMYMEQASDAEANIVTLNNQVYMAKYIRNYLTDSEKQNLVLPMNVGINNQSLTQQISDYNEKLLERNTLADNSSDSNPLVVDADKALKSMREAIITAIDNELVALDEQIKSQRDYGGKALSQIASNPEQAKYLLSVERRQKVVESLYLFLLQKREENELSQTFSAYNSRVITPPYGNEYPSSPRKKVIIAIAFLLGLAIPFGIIYLQQVTNTTVRGRKDIEDKLSIPFLGEIPQYAQEEKKKSFLGISINARKKKLNEKNGIVVSEKNSRDYINEAFRVLRTNLHFVSVGKGNVSVITSYNPGSGKSFIINNLAVSVAIRKRKVLLIDCDLRKGSTSQYYDSPKRGLSNYLAGDIEDISDIIMKVEGYDNFYIIPSGPIPPNPSELVADDKFTKLIENLKKDYDYVFIDCPPVDIVADTSIIDKVADRTLFVIRAGLFERSMLKTLENDYEKSRFVNMELILNGTDVTMGSYGHRYGYHYGYGYGRRYGYGYGYGYGKKADSESKEDTSSKKES